MRGYIKLLTFDCSFYFDKSNNSLNVILPQKSLSGMTLFRLHQSGELDKIPYLDATTTDGESLRFYFDYLSTSNNNIDYRVTHYVIFDSLNKANFGKHVSEFKQIITFTGDVINALFSPKRALKFDEIKQETNSEGYLINFEHQITDLDYDLFEKRGRFHFQGYDCEYTFTVHRGFSTEDSNYLESYKSALQFEFHNDVVFSIDDLNSFYFSIYRLLKFIFRISDFRFRTANFRLKFNKTGFLNFGSLEYRSLASAARLNKRLEFDKILPCFSNLIDLFLEAKIYLNHISNLVNGYENCDLPFLFSFFDSEFKNTYPDVNKSIDDDFTTASNKIKKILDEAKNTFINNEFQIVGEINQFLSNSELSFRKKILHAVNNSNYLNEKFKKINLKNFTDKIVEFRNSMIHGRSYNNKENIDFQEIVLFEKICYQMVLKRANLTEEELEKFVETILFSFQNNLLK